MNTEFILLALYESPTLGFPEVCKAIGISTQTGYNLRGQKAFPIPLFGNPLRAAIQDVAKYIDDQREAAQFQVKA